jgi:hypothetical protein
LTASRLSTETTARRIAISMARFALASKALAWGSKIHKDSQIRSLSMTPAQLKDLVLCYLDLHGNRISEPEFSTWLSSLATSEEVSRFRRTLL